MLIYSHQDEIYYGGWAGQFKSASYRSLFPPLKALEVITIQHRKHWWMLDVVRHGSFYVIV